MASKGFLQKAKALRAIGQASTSNVASLPNASSALIDAVGSKGSYTDLISAQKDAKVADEEQKKQDSQIVNEAISDTEDLIDEEVSKNETTSEGVSGDGSTAANVVGKSENNVGFDYNLNNIKLQNDIVKNMVTSLGNSAPLAIEKLDVSDYYPNASKNIAVGTYSGKYLGSATIFAAPGARIPFGLYDARKRALADSVKAKQAQLEKILSIPETSAQYQDMFNEYYLNNLNEHLTRLNWNADKFSTDMDAVRFMAQMQAKAREITESVTFADSILASSKEDGQYTPSWMVDLAIKTKNAVVDDFDGIMAGDKNAVQVFNDARVYRNMMPRIDELVKQNLSKENLSELPLNLRTGGKYETEEFISDRNDFFQQVQDGSADYETYVDGIRRFFGGDYETMIDSLFAGESNVTEEQKEHAKRYFASQIQSSVILDYKQMANDKLGWANLAERKRQYDTTRQDNKNDFWGVIAAGQQDAVNQTTGMSYNDEIKALANKNLTAEQKDKELKRINQQYGVSNQTYKDSNGTYVNRVLATEDLAKSQPTAKPQVGADGSKSRYYKVKFTYPNGQVVYKNLTATEIGARSSNYDLTTKNKALKPNQPKMSVAQAGGYVALTGADVESFSKVTGSLYTKEIAADVRNGYYDGNTGKYLDASNISGYSSSGKKFTSSQSIETGYGYERRYNEVTGKYDEVTVPLKGDVFVNEQTVISNEEGAMVKNSQWGYTPRQAGMDTSPGSTTVTSSSYE